MNRASEEVVLFYSYASEDRLLRDRLEKHLSILKYTEQITTWHHREIHAGREWEKEIDAYLEQASIILLLISVDYLASGYCYGVEMKRALQKHEQRTARVIPILLRPVDWEGSPIEKLQVLPKNAKPVTSWRQRDDAFVNIAQGIREVVTELRGPIQKLRLRIVPNHVLTRVLIDALHTVKADSRKSQHFRYYMQALRGCEDLLESIVWSKSKSSLPFDEEIIKIGLAAEDMLRGMGLYTQAMAVCQELPTIKVTDSDASLATLQCCKLAVLHFYLGGLDTALFLYQKALNFSNNFYFPYVFYSSSILFYIFERYEKAYRAREQAIGLDPYIVEKYSDWEYALEEPEGYRDTLVTCL